MRVFQWKVLMGTLGFPNCEIEGFVKGALFVVAGLASLSFRDDHAGGNDFGPLVFLVLQTHQVWLQIARSGTVASLTLHPRLPQGSFQCSRSPQACHDR